MTKEVKKDSGCVCQKCQKIYKIDVLIETEIWEKIKPKNKPEGSGLLCGECIINELENFNVFGAYQLIKL